MFYNRRMYLFFTFPSPNKRSFTCCPPFFVLAIIWLSFVSCKNIEAKRPSFEISQVTESIYDLMGSESPSTHRMDEIFSNMDSNRFTYITVVCKIELNKKYSNKGMWFKNILSSIWATSQPTKMAGYFPIIELSQIDGRRKLMRETVFSKELPNRGEIRKFEKADKLDGTNFLKDIFKQVEIIIIATGCWGVFKPGIAWTAGGCLDWHYPPNVPREQSHLL